MVICLERGADLHMAQRIPLPLTVFCFSKIQIGFTFLVLAHPGSPGQRPLNGFVCVCVFFLSRTAGNQVLETKSSKLRLQSIRSGLNNGSFTHRIQNKCTHQDVSRCSSCLRKAVWKSQSGLMQLNSKSISDSDMMSLWETAPRNHWQKPAQHLNIQSNHPATTWNWR